MAYPPPAALSTYAPSTAHCCACLAEEPNKVTIEEYPCLGVVRCPDAETFPTQYSQSPRCLPLHLRAGDTERAGSYFFTFAFAAAAAVSISFAVRG